MNSMKNKKELDFGLISKYRSLLMGAAILLIMFCHLDIAEIRHGVENTRLAIYLHNGTVGVDMFVFLSGFGLFYSYSKNPLPYWKFEMKRINKILPYYFLIGGVTYLIHSFLTNQFSAGKLLQDLLFISWYKEGSTKYWYVLAILVFYLLFPGIDPFIRGKKHSFLLIALFSVIWFAVVEALSHSYEKIDLFRMALDRLPIFILGIYAGREAYEKRSVKEIHAAFSIFLGIILLMLQKKVIPYPWNRYLYYPIRGALAISVMSFLIVFMEAMEKNAPRVCIIIMNGLAWFGGLTYELYLLHQSFMILFEFPYHLPRYCLVAFVLPTITAAGLFLIRKALKKRQTA